MPVEPMELAVQLQQVGPHTKAKRHRPNAAVLLSVAATAKRHRVNPWVYVKDLLITSAARKPDVDFDDLLLDAWLQAHTTSMSTP